MKKVERNELLGLAEYEEIRPQFRSRIIREKEVRRVLVCDEVSVVFENRDTVLFQIQEMLRTERITKEAAIMHEIETYNDLVPGEGELSATMFVEIGDAATRERRLVELVGLEGSLGLEVLGTKIAARNETRGVLSDRTTAVHYIKFPLGTELAARLAERAKEAEGAMFFLKEAAGRLGGRVQEAAEGAMYFLIDHPKLSVRKEIPPATVRSLADDLKD